MKRNLKKQQMNTVIDSFSIDQRDIERLPRQEQSQYYAEPLAVWNRYQLWLTKDDIWWMEPSGNTNSQLTEQHSLSLRLELNQKT